MIGTILFGCYLFFKEDIDGGRKLKPEPNVSAQQTQYDISKVSPEPLEANYGETSKSVQSPIFASDNPSNIINNGQVEDVKKEKVVSNNFQQEMPDLLTHINDLTNTLSTDQKYQLEEKFNLVQKLKGINIIFLIIPSTQPENFVQFSERAKTKWKLMQPDYLSGVLVLFTGDNRQLNVFIGNSVDTTLDLHIGRIVNESFSQPDYYRTLNNAAEEFITLNTEKIQIKPSFDCDKANSKTELLICNDLELAKLDSDLAETYKKAKSITMNADALKEATKAAWKWRESFCRDKECLVKWYIERNDDLLKIIQGGVF